MAKQGEIVDPKQFVKGDITDVSSEPISSKVHERMMQEAGLLLESDVESRAPFYVQVATSTRSDITVLLSTYVHKKDGEAHMVINGQVLAGKRPKRVEEQQLKILGWREQEWDPEVDGTHPSRLKTPADARRMQWQEGKLQLAGFNSVNVIELRPEDVVQLEGVLPDIPSKKITPGVERYIRPFVSNGIAVTHGEWKIPQRNMEVVHMVVGGAILEMAEAMYGIRQPEIDVQSHVLGTDLLLTTHSN